ncbi:MAG: cytochrome c biogenesis heme-transporting ATPase CcmA [Burkholderiaceae bacterium]
MTDPTNGLQLRAVGCERGGRVLFANLDCSVSRGQLLRVRGPNGAGKTSLLRMLCGLLPPAQGEILWQGQPIRALAEEFGRQLVYIGHAAALKDDLTTLENLQTACHLGGLRISQEQALSALRQAGLAGREHAAARLLSQGQRRRVALARLVVAGQAPLWILDEPFNALDSAATDWLGTLISAHLTQGGVVALTSHQPVSLDEVVNQVRLEL